MLIYKITCTKTNKIYIGKTKRSLKERWAEHCKPTFKTRSALSRAIQKYGKESFLLEELAQTSSEEDLNKLEKQFIELNNCMAPRGYNLTAGGVDGYISNLTKRKISKNQTGKICSQETKNKLSAILKGRAAHNRKPVIGTNIKTGEIIELPHGYADKRFTAVQIANCCNGKRKQHKGYNWRYK